MAQFSDAIKAAELLDTRRSFGEDRELCMLANWSKHSPPPLARPPPPEPPRAVLAGDLEEFRAGLSERVAAAQTPVAMEGGAGDVEEMFVEVIESLERETGVLGQEPSSLLCEETFHGEAMGQPAPPRGGLAGATPADPRVQVSTPLRDDEEAFHREAVVQPMGAKLDAAGDGAMRLPAAMARPPGASAWSQPC